MKKIFLVSVISIFCAGVALASDMLPAGGYYETHSENCDVAAMRETLDRATADRRAVITVVKCPPRFASAGQADYQAEYAASDTAAGCGDAEVEQVVARRVYVEETVQKYRPIVHYIPAGTYTRTHIVCGECDI